MSATILFFKQLMFLCSMRSCCGFVGRFLRKKNIQARYAELRVWESLNFERAILRGAVYMIAILLALLCGFFNILYGIQFTQDQNRHWMTSVSISLFAGSHRGS